MNNFQKTLVVSIFLLIGGRSFAASNGELNKPAPKTSDSLLNNTNKSNDIVIFRLVPSPTPVTNNSGSLKNAGKVARTSNSRS